MQQPDVVVLFCRARLRRSGRLFNLSVRGPGTTGIRRVVLGRMSWRKVGVKSVRNIYGTLQQHRYETIVMEASFPAVLSKSSR